VELQIALYSANKIKYFFFIPLTL